MLNFYANALKFRAKFKKKDGKDEKIKVNVTNSHLLRTFLLKCYYVFERQSLAKCDFTELGKLAKQRQIQISHRKDTK